MHAPLASCKIERRSNCASLDPRIRYRAAAPSGEKANGRRFRRSLLEGHRPAGRARHLHPLRPQDLRRPVAGAARDRSLRTRLSGRAEAGGGTAQDLRQAPAAKTPMPRSSRPSGCSPRRARPAFRSSTPRQDTRPDSLPSRVTATKRQRVPRTLRSTRSRPSSSRRPATSSSPSSAPAASTARR